MVEGRPAGAGSTVRLLCCLDCTAKQRSGGTCAGYGCSSCVSPGCPPHAARTCTGKVRPTSRLISPSSPVFLLQRPGSGLGFGFDSGAGRSHPATWAKGCGGWCNRKRSRKRSRCAPGHVEGDVLVAPVAQRAVVLRRAAGGAAAGGRAALGLHVRHAEGPQPVAAAGGAAAAAVMSAGQRRRKRRRLTGRGKQAERRCV